MSLLFIVTVRTLSSDNEWLIAIYSKVLLKAVRLQKSLFVRMPNFYTTHHSLRVQIKHLSIPANQTFIKFDNVFTNFQLDLVVVGTVNDGDLAGGYQRNPFNYQNFYVNRIEPKRNGTHRPTEGYSPNFAKDQCIKAYLTFFQKLKCDIGFKSVSLTQSEWANGYTWFAFKITDGFIGPGTYGLRSKFAIKSARLEILFAAAVNENIKVIIYYQILGRIGIDKYYVVVVLWV